MAAYSPMMQQYLGLKRRYPDTIVFFRLGDFYEMFFEDAEKVSALLNLTLTGRDAGDGVRAPMCGVPHHSASAYINRLVSLGHRVAICEQMGDPAQSRGLVEREVVRIVTPGTNIDQEPPDTGQSRYLLSMSAFKKRAGLAWVDVSAGEFRVLELESVGELADTVASIAPAEIIADALTQETLDGLGIRQIGAGIERYADEAFALTAARKTILAHFNSVDTINSVRTDPDMVGEQALAGVTLESLGLAALPMATRAAGGLLSYLNETQRTAMTHITGLIVSERSGEMGLDRVARRNLELTETMRGQKGGGTLFHLLNDTRTAMGARMLRQWVERPMAVRARIEPRLDAVALLAADTPRLGGITQRLKGIADLERLLCKVSYRSFTARDALALRAAFAQIPGVRAMAEALGSGESGVPPVVLTDIINALDSMADLCALLDRMIDPNPPPTHADGGFIKAGYNEELDTLRKASEDGRHWIADLESRERQATGVKTLKIIYNRVYGYVIEISKGQAERAPDRYIRRQTLTGSERFTTPELTRMEETIIGAKDKSIRLEQELFGALVDWIAGHTARMRGCAEALARLDALCSLASVAVRRDYVRPTFNDNGVIDIKDGRHPVVETMLKDELFIPNDTHLDNDSRVQILTGPNMAGKSTYMRQVALIVLMAQMGGFVPARAADLCIVDRLFTRVGASDDLASGQSTFLVEMSESASILKAATNRSLILLDEIGRGTSTFDGLSIAWAITEYVAEKIGAKTLFATHYHELSELEGQLPGVVNYSVSVKEQGEHILFLRRIERGGADKSFGIHVARLAGLPRPVVMRATAILARIEAANHGGAGIGRSILEKNKTQARSQLAIGESERAALIDDLRALDVMSMNPIEALNTLFKIHERAKNV
ncbi:MAG: DNA mismatch repair protein MutS [Oscillospiraceae bacterium]|jgi:DNA mismatch repair protein MutS|nr:DNA mismatch repair protein MutS [Oscillospiraceae bacterium]